MKEYTFIFLNVHRKYVIYGKGDECQRVTIRTLPKMAKTNENGRNVLWWLKKVSFQNILQNITFCE